MPQALTTDILLRSVGKRVKDDQDKLLGEIVEITRNPAGDAIEYAILKSNQLFDQEDRFFAIPVSSVLIKITEAGEIIMQTSKEELHQANGIYAAQCPNPNFLVKPNIFEIIDYDDPKTPEALT